MIEVAAIGNGWNDRNGSIVCTRFVSVVTSTVSAGAGRRRILYLQQSKSPIYCLCRPIIRSDVQTLMTGSHAAMDWEALLGYLEYANTNSIVENMLMKVMAKDQSSNDLNFNLDVL